MNGSSLVIPPPIVQLQPVIQPSFIESFLSNPSAIISFAAMLITIILFCINIFVVRKNAMSDFKRKINLSYFELTIITSMKEIFKTIGCIKKEYCSLRTEYLKNTERTDLREVCQKYTQAIDDLIENLEANSLVYVKVFSKDAGEKLAKEINDFYDSCTDVFSKYSIQNLTDRNIDIYNSAMNKLLADIVKKTYDICKAQTP